MYEYTSRPTSVLTVAFANGCALSWVRTVVRISRLDILSTRARRTYSAVLTVCTFGSLSGLIETA